MLLSRPLHLYLLQFLLCAALYTAWFGASQCCVCAWIAGAPCLVTRRTATDNGWTPLTTSRRWRRTTVSILSVLNDDVDSEQQQVEGTERIRMAMRTCGWDPEAITIQWQPQQKKIVVTVVDDGTYVSAPEGDGPDGDIEAGLFDDTEAEAAAGYDADDEGEEPLLVDSDTDDATDAASVPGSSGIDLAVLARAINVALEGLEPVASSFVVEVTTPGIASNNRSDQPLVGDVMFQAYRGFGVTAVYDPPDNKKKKPQRIEGKLVERNELHTIVNVKGRMRKLLNEHVVEVCLPPAKKEKK